MKETLRSQISRFSIQRKLFLIFGFMTCLIVFELLMLRYSMSNLTAVRAFVYGESVWSKAQKDSAYYLKRMGITKSEEDFASYNKSLFVPRECRVARLELYKENPNHDLIVRGFINGKIHPDEVGPILHMISAFSWLEHIEAALQTWKEADEILQEFEKNAELFHSEVMAANPDRVKIQELSSKLDSLNFELGKAEDRFSDALQQGARWLESVVFISLILLVVLVSLTGLLLVHFFGRDLVNRIDALVNRARKIGRKEFEAPLVVDKEDELGTLMVSVNHMSSMIQSSQEELEDRVREAVKTRDEFFSIATHELRTPVTAILLRLQMMERDLASKPELAKPEVLNHIRSVIQLVLRLRKLQDTLMDVTKISAGMFTLDKAPSDLMEIVRNSVEQARDPESKARIHITGPDKVSGNFDMMRVEQVMVNLIRNALKYGEGSDVEINVQATKASAKVYVSDHGKGIPENMREKIFERFTRVNQDAGISGLGMGLYISREITRVHGGEIRLLTSSTEGTTFEVILPF